MIFYNPSEKSNKESTTSTVAPMSFEEVCLYFYVVESDNAGNRILKVAYGIEIPEELVKEDIEHKCYKQLLKEKSGDVVEEVERKTTTLLSTTTFAESKYGSCSTSSS